MENLALQGEMQHACSWLEGVAVGESEKLCYVQQVHTMTSFHSMPMNSDGHRQSFVCYPVTTKTASQ